MIRVREYKCAAGHIVEVFAKEHHDVTRCNCGELARVQPSAPRSRLEGITGSFPGAADAWVRKRIQKQAEERRRERDHGDSGWR